MNLLYAPDERRPPAVDLPARILARCEIDAATGCHLWQGSITPNGYGKISIAAVTRSTHRAAYEAAKGPVPAGLVIDHLCRNPRCCNPDHLEAVTPRENTLRGVGPSAQHAKKTHCPKGHPFDAANTGRLRNQRVCRACAKERERQRRLRVRAS